MHKSYGGHQFGSCALFSRKVYCFTLIYSYSQPKDKPIAEFTVFPYTLNHCRQSRARQKSKVRLGRTYAKVLRSLLYERVSLLLRGWLRHIWCSCHLLPLHTLNLRTLYTTAVSVSRKTTTVALVCLSRTSKTEAYHYNIIAIGPQLPL